MPENEEIWRLLIMGQTQWKRTGEFATAYALDYAALMMMAKSCRMQVDAAFIENLSIYEHETLKVFNGSGSEGYCDKKQKAKCKAEFGEYINWACKQCESNPENRK